VLNLNVPHPLQNVNRFGLPENSVVAELVAERLAALVLLKMQNCISVDNGRLIIQQRNKVVKAKHIENIDSWTDAFLNYAKILVENHTTMASELFLSKNVNKCNYFENSLF
jgi:hypothetical protein